MMKVLASDFDGTLSQNGFYDEKREAIKRWRSKGNVLAIVSGRCAENLITLPIEHSFECDYLLAHNGAVVMKTDGTIISKNVCDGSIVVPLMKLMFESGCTYADVGTSFPCKICADITESRADEGIYCLNDLPNIQSFTQISTMCKDCDTAKNIAFIIKKHFGDVLNPLQNGAFIDIVRADINKAKGIYILMDFLGARYKDVITVGDNVNDTDMIAEFKSYAMANGVDSIKALADDTVSDVSELIEKEI